MYLLSARVFLVARRRAGAMVRIVLLVATFPSSGAWATRSPARGFLWLLAGWTVMCAVVSTRAWRDEGRPRGAPDEVRAGER
jgi:hypothetical protein